MNTGAIVKLAVVGTLGLVFSAAASASCYTVLNRKGDIIYRNFEPPVDMRGALRNTVPRRFGAGAVMVFEVDDTPCAPINAAPRQRVGTASVDQAVRALAERNDPRANIDPLVLDRLGENARALR